MLIELMIPVLGISASHAGGTQPIFRLNAGVAVPAQPAVFREYWNIGFNVGMGAGIAINEMAEIYSSVDYGSNSGDLVKNIKFLTAFGNVKLNIMPDANATPYVVIGVGLFRKWDKSNDESAFGAHGSLGVR